MCVERFDQRCRKHFESGGCISTFFLIFWQFQKVGGVAKSQQIDPFFDVIYLFLNVRFGQKVLKFTHFWMPSSYVLNVPFGTFCRRLNLTFFYLTIQKIFLHIPYFSLTPLKKFLPLPKNFFTTRPKNSLLPFIFPKFLNFLLPPSNFHFSGALKSGGVRPKKRGC